MKLTHLRFFAAFFLLIFLIYTTGVRKFFDTLMCVNLYWAVLAVWTSFLLVSTAVMNVWILLRTLRPISFENFFNHYMKSFVVTLLAPGQMGDASLTLFLKQEGIPIRQSSVVYLLDKTITLLVFLSVSAWGAEFILPSLNRMWFKFVPATGFFVFWAGILWALKHLPKLSRFPKIQTWLIGAQDTVDVLLKHWPFILLNILLAGFKWLLMSLSYFFAFLAFKHVVSWPVIGVIPILSSLVGYIPISLGGIGVAEGAAVYLFNLQGVEKSVVLSSYILLRLIQFGLAAGLFMFFKKSSSHQNYEGR